MLQAAVAEQDGGEMQCAKLVWHGLHVAVAAAPDGTTVLEPAAAHCLPSF